MRHLPTVKKHYDDLEQQGVAIPEEFENGKLGACSLEYVLELNPGALAFVAELTYGQHPGDASEQEIGQSLRQLNLRLAADNKFLATIILEEWEKVKGDLDITSPFYRKILNDLILAKDKLHIGVTEWYEQPIQSLLFNPAESRAATERDRIQAYMFKIFFLGNASAFGRLLKVSKQTAAVRQAIERFEQAFDAAIKDMQQHLDFAAFKVTDCDTLAKVQLGSGLIALNSILQARVA